MKERLGFIGLGIMGKPMSQNLIKAGYSLVVYDIVPEKAQELASLGAEVACCRDVAERCNTLIIMVPDSPDVEQVILGQNGVLEGVRPGSIVIDMSTISPRVTRELAAKLKEKGAHMLDAPVTGGQRGAIEGTLSIMVGGEKEILERCLPIFQAMGRRVTYMGSNGMGQVTKLVNQILAVINAAGVAEGLVFAAKAGLDLAATIEAVKGGVGGSWQLENLGPRAIRGDFAPGFMVKLQQKDVRLILEMARELQLPLPVTSLVHHLYRVAEVEGWGEEGTQALVKVLEKLGGVEARVRPAQ
jgi:3-hydroxyisobutyrate dehydrogenase